MNDMTKQERIDMLREAQEKLFEAIGLLEDAIGDDANAVSYLIDHLKILASDDYGFVSDDLNMDQLIREVENGERR